MVRYHSIPPLKCLRVTNQLRDPYGGVAQLDEHRSSKPKDVGSNPITPATKLTGCSSAGRTLASGARGREFEPHHSDQYADICTIYLSMLELADIRDLKSLAFVGVGVRIPLERPFEGVAQ